MSIKTFFQHVGEFFLEAFKKAPSFEQVASTTLKLAAPLLGTVLTLIAGPAAATKAQGIISQVQADMAGLATALSGAGIATGNVTLTSFLESIKTNLGTLLTDADIKNEAKFSEIEGVANTFIGEIEAIAGAIPPPPSPTHADGTVNTAAAQPAAPATPAA
jgi:hypothetical protein